MWFDDSVRTVALTHTEKDHLNYLGSMLHVDPSDEEEEQQRILDAFDRAREQVQDQPSNLN